MSQRAANRRPLRDYAGIGDGRTVALIATDGSVDWLPVPAIDSPAVFAGILDPRGGRFRLQPVDAFATTRHYAPGTNVLVTRFTTSSGVADLTDALATGAAGRLPWTELARRVDGISGTVRFEWSVEPSDLFERGTPERVSTPHGWLLRSGTINLAIVGSEHGPVDTGRPAYAGSFATTPGSRHVLALVATDGEPVHLPDPRVVDEGIDRTIANWTTWSREIEPGETRWADQVRRSILALKLLVFSPSGSIAAAATTSLPESRDGGKNWDYRYAWIRDLSYATEAMLDAGLREEPHAAVSWMLTSLKRHGDRLAVFFALDGADPSPTVEVDAEGWDGIGPVRVGNRAADQVQLGVYADVLSLLQRYVEHGNMLDRASSDLLARLATDVCDRWRRRDSGMWELVRQRHYVSSKMGCWQALDAACRLADGGHITPDPTLLRRWRRNRDAIRAWVDRHGWSEKRGAYVMHPRSRRLDASVLLHARTGFDDGERMSRTIDAIRTELGDGSLLHRYTGMSDEEGAFVACSFWAAEALASVGRLDEARDLMDQLVELPNDVGMLSEMIDPVDGSFLGNLPQALSHLALIRAAHLIEEKGQRRRG